jgi:hypothetical protein
LSLLNNQYIVETIVDGRVIRTGPVPKRIADSVAHSHARNPTVERVRLVLATIPTSIDQGGEGPTTRDNKRYRDEYHNDRQI